MSQEELNGTLRNLIYENVRNAYYELVEAVVYWSELADITEEMIDYVMDGDDLSAGTLQIHMSERVFLDKGTPNVM